MCGDGGDGAVHLVRDGDGVLVVLGHLEVGLTVGHSQAQ